MVSRSGRDDPDVARPQLDAVLLKERRGQLEEAIRELPRQMRRCLVLRVYRELSYREIATALKLSIDTVKAHLFQARKKLKERLNDLDLEELAE